MQTTRMEKLYFKIHWNYTHILKLVLYEEKEKRGSEGGESKYEELNTKSLMNILSFWNAWEMIECKEIEKTKHIHSKKNHKTEHI